MGKYANVKVLTSSKKDFDEMLERFGRHEKRYGYQLFQQMMGYFQKTGYDPAEEFETPAAEVKKLRNTLVSFIRKQEKDYIVPLNDKVDHLIKVTASVGVKIGQPESSDSPQKMTKNDSPNVDKESDLSSDDTQEVETLKMRIAELEEEKSALLEKQTSMLKLYRKIGNSLEKTRSGQTSTGMTPEWVIFNFSRKDYQTIQNYVREDS